MTLTVGDVAPSVSLPDTDGSSWTIPDGDQTAATVVAFTCNHCPYAIAWHERILDAARDYAGRGVRVLLINSNDAHRFPRDSYQAMRERVAALRTPTTTIRASGPRGFAKRLTRCWRAACRTRARPNRSAARSSGSPEPAAALSPRQP